VSKEEINSYWDRIARFFPEEYESLKKVLPDSLLPLRTKKLSEYLQRNKKSDIESNVLLIARYAYKACGLYMSDELLDEIFTIENFDAIYTNALLESYYGANGCFLEENQLLSDAYRIKNIPTIIVNGRYDMVCLPYTAYKLHMKLPASKLIIVEEAGHLQSENPNEIELLKAMREFE
jgi:proline iminopeptidase